MPTTANTTPTNLIILSGYTPNIKGFAEVASANHRAYAAKHGYDYRCFQRGFYPLKAPSWSKLLFLRHTLSEIGEFGGPKWSWALWIDSDAIFTNFEISLENFIASAEDQHEIIIGEDAWGINAGVWFARNTRWTLNFISDIWTYDPQPFAQAKLQPPVWVDQPRYMLEQSTMWHLANIKNETSKLKLLHYSQLGGYLGEFDQDSYTARDQAMRPPTQNAPITRNSWEPGDFCLHLAGVPEERKLALMENAISSIKV